MIYDFVRLTADQPPLWIGFAVVATILAVVILIGAVVMVLKLSLSWLRKALAPEVVPVPAIDETPQRARLQAATLAGPAAKGWHRDNIEPVGDELARHVFAHMKRIEDPRPLHVVGTGTRSLRVEVK